MPTTEKGTRDMKVKAISSHSGKCFLLIRNLVISALNWMLSQARHDDTKLTGQQ
jgi:hypothetical protein